MPEGAKETLSYNYLRGANTRSGFRHWHLALDGGLRVSDRGFNPFRRISGRGFIPVCGVSERAFISIHCPIHQAAISRAAINRKEEKTDPMPTQPVFIATWPFGVAACATGWTLLSQGASALDAIEAAANVTEDDPAVNSVGYGGLPNADGVVELDAAIMDGPTHGAGAVGAITRFRRPISIARRVMEATPHVFLVGENADRFALAQGFAPQELSTDVSRAAYENWRRERSAPDVAHFTYGKTTDGDVDRASAASVAASHDTIGLCALDANGNLAAGCTTSGMAWKVPGRVGDSPVIGSGLYVDNAVGGAAATGNGDEMMKACLSYRVVLGMERGLTPQQACEEAIRYLLAKRPPEIHHHYGAAIIALRRDGQVGAAATQSGFSARNRWQWAVANSPAPVLNEGSYLTPDGSVLARLD